MKASKVMGVVGSIVLLIIIKIAWKALRNEIKSGGSEMAEKDGSEKAGPYLNETIFLYPWNLSTTEPSRNSTKIFVVLDSYKVFARPYFTTNKTLTEIEITNSSDFSSNFTKKVYNKRFTSDCSNKRIYILKSSTPHEASEQVLDVIEYDDSNKFQRIKRIPNMFNGAVSIVSDWTTGNIYWIENIEGDTYAIKVTNKSFDKPEYVIQPTTGYFMRDIQVYPKKKEIFFFNGSSIWYTSTSCNSTSKLLFSPTIESIWMDNLVIDYELNKLCFLYYYDNLNCVDIANSSRPINVQLITSQEVPMSTVNLAVANNTFYWITSRRLLYRKNVNDTSNEVAFTVGSGTCILSFFSSNCSFAGEPNDNAADNETTTILSSKETEAAPKISLPLNSTEKGTV